MRPIRVVATYLLFLAFSINVVVLIAPALYSVPRSTSSTLPKSYGFFSTCDCVWNNNLLADVTNSNNGFSKNMWWHWLYIGAVSIMNICLFSWFILSFFGRKVHYVSMTVMGAFMLIAAGLVGATICLFAVTANKELGVALTGPTRFDWAMWLSIPGFALTILTALVFIIQGPSLYRSQKRHRDK